MAYQDPEDRRRATDYIDRSGPQVGWLPLVLGVAFVAVLGFLVFGTWSTPADRPVTGQRTELPNAAPKAPPAPTPTPPTQK